MGGMLPSSFTLPESVKCRLLAGHPGDTLSPVLTGHPQAHRISYAACGYL